MIRCILCVISLSNLAATFAAPVDWDARAQVGTRNTGIVGTGDFNADGINDVAIAINNGFVWYPGPDFSAADEATLGAGSGTSYGGTVADMNGDGWPDLVAADGARNAGPGRLWLFLHPGSAAAATGPWQRIEIYSEDVWHQNDLDVADLDGDGRLDVLVRTRADDRRVLVALQNADINTWTTRAWPTGETANAPEGIGVGDVDLDGEAEIILSGVFWDNPGGWRTGEPVEYLIDSSFVGKAIKAVVADLDNDGQDDDVVMSKAEGSQEIFLAWYRLDGDPASGASAWTRTLLLDNVSAMHALEVADIDQDGHNDIYGGNSFGESGLYVFYGSNNGATWTQQIVDAGGKQYVASLVDLDGDTDLDIVGPATWQGTVYRYTNRLLDGGPPLDAPAAPDQLTVDTLSATSVSLSWRDNANNETQFVIERRLAVQGPFEPVAQLGANVTLRVDANLTPSTQYEYRVFASNPIGDSDYSNVVSATTDDPPPPDLEPPTVPQQVQIVSVNFNQIDLNWAAATDNVGVTGYRVYLFDNALDDTAATSFAASGLTPVTEYTFAVTALDVAGNESALSASVTAQTGEAPNLSDLILAYYRLDSAAGETATDATGNFPGALRGQPLWDTDGGQYAGALSFGGGDDAVDLGVMDIADGDGLTMAAWVNVDSVAGIASESRFISKANGTVDQAHYWMLGSYLDGTALRFRLKTDTTTTLISPTGVLPLGEWAHVAATYDGAAMRAYVNGVEVASTAKNGPVAMDPTVAVALGNQPAGLLNRGLVGRLDDVYVLRSALDDDEIMLVMGGLTTDCAAAAADCDGDGVVAANDNCLVAANPMQVDADSDGFGNACDADFNNDCVTNVEDLGLLRSVFFTADPVADLTGDGVVNVVDLGALRSQFFMAPGPSAFADCDDAR